MDIDLDRYSKRKREREKLVSNIVMLKSKYHVFVVAK